MRFMTLFIGIALAVGCQPAAGNIDGNVDENDDNLPAEPAPADLDQDGRPDVLDLVVTGNKDVPNIETLPSISPSQRVEELYAVPLGSTCDTSFPLWRSGSKFAFTTWTEEGSHAYVVQHLTWDEDGDCTSVNADMSGAVGLDDTIQVNTNTGPVFAREFLCIHSNDDVENGDYTTSTGDHATCQREANEADAAVVEDGGGTTDNNVERSAFTWRFGFGPEITNTTTLLSFTVKNLTTGETFVGTRENISTVAVNITSGPRDLFDLQCYLSTDADAEAEDWCASNLHGGRIYNATGPTGSYTVGSAATNDIHYADVDNGKHYQWAVKP